MRTTITLTVGSTLARFILTGLGLGALASCSGDAVTSPAATQSRTASSRIPSADARGRASVPISGTCALTVLATIPYPAPPVFKQVATGSCTLSHLGKTTVHFVQLVDFGTQTQHSLELTYTAANGDVLRATSAGTSAPIAGGVRFSAVISFAGGTGRFANASGSADATGTADLVTGTSQYQLAGWITPNGANAR